MFDRMALPSLLAAFLSPFIINASPIESNWSLIPRDETIRCSNAPGVVPGTLVTQADVVLTSDLPPSGSSEEWQKYLWCTPGTQTYTFFSFGPMSPPPSTYGYFNIYEAFNLGIANLALDMAINGGDGFMSQTGNGAWGPPVPNTNCWLNMHDTPPGRLTYGIMGSALKGLANAAQNFNKGNFPMVFQIYDGEWGHVGTGFNGLVPERSVYSTWHSSTCTVGRAPGVEISCAEIR